MAYRQYLIAANGVVLLPMILVSITALRAKFANSLPSGLLVYYENLDIYMMSLLNIILVFLLVLKSEQRRTIGCLVVIQLIFSLFLAIDNLVFMVMHPLRAPSAAPIFSLVWLLIAYLDMRFLILNFFTKDNPV